MIILFFFPVMILIFNDIRRAASWLWTGKKPTAESVERVIIDMQKEHMFDQNEHSETNQREEVSV